MIRAWAELKSLLSGERSTKGKRKDLSSGTSIFTLLRDLIESLESIIQDITFKDIAITGNAEINEYTKLGSSAPAIKMKKITGTTGANEGDQTSFAHGLTMSKIISYQVLVNNSASNNRIPPTFTSVNEHEYDVFIDATDVHVYLSAANSGGIKNGLITVLITYEE